MRRTGFAIGFFILLLLYSAAQADWRYYGADAASSKYAPLDQIDRDNFADLRVVWRWRPPDEALVAASPDLNIDYFRCVPLVVDGVLYAITPLGIVVALDAATGAQLWAFDSGAAAANDQWFGNLYRGVAHWRDGDDERILFATATDLLFSLDAKTGRPDPAFGDSGRVDLSQGLRRSFPVENYAVPAPPIVCRDVIVVGSSVSDIRGGPTPRGLPPGDVRGFDVRTGQQQWVFETIPQPGDFGHETWGLESWRDFGGANVWSMMSADEELGYVYLPVSTPSNDFYGGERPGDNLFGDSIVCLDAATGERVWHFQITHHGLWDYDPPAAPILVDIEVDGKPIKAVVQLTKQAHTFVFDRVTGAPVWPILELPVPASAAAGEAAAPTQPFPTWPLPFDLQGLRRTDLIDFTPELRRKALEQISEYEYGPLYTPPSQKGTLLIPGLRGGANWVGGAVDPRTGVLYVPSHTMPYMAVLDPVDDPEAPSAYATSNWHNVKGPDGLPLTKPPYGRLTAIDLNSGDHLWMQIVGRGPADHPALQHLDLPDLGWPGLAHVLATPELVLLAPESPRDAFFGPDYGGDYYIDREAQLRAYDPATGALLGAVDLPGNASANPVSYQAGGRQYIVVPLGDGNRPSELVALALPRRGEELPPQPGLRADAEHGQFYAAVAAFDRGDTKALKKLLKKHQDLAAARGYLDDYYEYPDFRGATLLHHIAGAPLRAKLPANIADLATALLDAGADPDAVTVDSLTTLDLVTDSQQLRWADLQGELIGLLAARGADLNAGGGKLLWKVLTDPEPATARLLVERGAAVDLRFAAGVNRLDLLAEFFDPAGGLTPAANRLYRTSPDTALSDQQLLDEALHYAAYNGATEAVDYLLARGADINGRCGTLWDWDWGTTALHKAVDAHDPAMITYLLDRGADPDLGDVRWNGSAYDWSGWYGVDAMRKAFDDHKGKD